MTLLTLGWWWRENKKFEQYMAAGEFSVWPFVTLQDYEASVKHPRYLTKPQG